MLWIMKLDPKTESVSGTILTESASILCFNYQTPQLYSVIDVVLTLCMVLGPHCIANLWFRISR